MLAEDSKKEGYPLFIEKIKHESAAPVVQDVRQLVHQIKQRTLPRPQASKLLHQGLTQLGVKCLKSAAFKGEMDESVMEHLEKFVLLKVTNELYALPSDRTEDDRIINWIDDIREAKMYTNIGGGTQNDNIKTLVDELDKIDLYRSPKDKIVTLLNLQDLLISRHHGLSTIEMMKSLFVEARPKQLCSNLEWIAHYRHPQRMTPEEHDCLQICFDAVQKIRIDGRLARARLQKVNFIYTVARRGRHLSKRAAGVEDGSSSSDFLSELDQCQFTFDKARSLNDLACSDIPALLAEYQQMCRTLRALEPDVQELANS